jgi:hypothetical protein
MRIDTFYVYMLNPPFTRHSVILRNSDVRVAMPE